MPQKPRNQTGTVRFGESLRRRREQRGLSQSELAARVELSRRRIGAIEAGEANPSLITLLSLAAALEIELAELVS